MESSIGGAQQLLGTEGNGQGHISRCVAGGRNRAHAGHDLPFPINELKLTADGREVFARVAQKNWPDGSPRFEYRRITKLS